MPIPVGHHPTLRQAGPCSTGLGCPFPAAVSPLDGLVAFCTCGIWGLLAVLQIFFLFGFIFDNFRNARIHQVPSLTGTFESAFSDDP